MHGLGLGYIYNKSLKSKFTVVNFNLKNLNLFRLIGGPSRFGGPRRTPSAPMRKRATVLQTTEGHPSEFDLTSDFHAAAAVS